MPRKKKADSAAAAVESESRSAAHREQASNLPPMQRPAYIDGPPTDADGRVIGANHSDESAMLPMGEQARPDERNWGNPYKALVTTANFEMGENRRFRQRVFLFKEKPSDEVLSALKDNGFTYRANEKAWTIQANPDTRKLSDELAREFTGQAVGVGRS